MKAVESDNPEVKDDVTGAIARMLLVAKGEKQEVLATELIERLPLTDDHAGWLGVLTAVELLVKQGNQLVAKSVPKIAEWSLESVSNLTLENHGDQRTLKKITNFVQHIKTADENLFDKLMQQMSTKSKSKLDQSAKLELDVCEHHH